MNCKNCNNPLPEGAKFCGKCGAKTIAESSPVVNTNKDKTVRGTRVAMGIIIGLVVFAAFFKIIAFIVSIGSALGLMIFDIHVSESERALANVEAAANILGFVGAAILANKVYKRITRKNIDPNAPVKKKKWY